MLRTIDAAYRREIPRSWHEDQIEVKRVIDGDSLEILVTSEANQETDFGFGFQERICATRKISITARLLGVALAPETAVAAARTYLESITVGRKVHGDTWKRDSSGRWLIVLYTEEGCINAQMVLNGYAVERDEGVR